MKNINKYLELVENAQDGIDTLFVDDDPNSPYSAGGKIITLDKILGRPPSLPALHMDFSQTERVIVLLWEFGGMSMWGTTQSKDKKDRWRQFIYFAKYGRIVHFRAGEEMSLARIFGLPDCVELSELTTSLNGQLVVIVLLI